MNTLLKALHALAAGRGDGLLTEFLAPEYRVSQAPKIANESAPSDAQPADDSKVVGS